MKFVRYSLVAFMLAAVLAVAGCGKKEATITAPAAAAAPAIASGAAGAVVKSRADPPLQVAGAAAASGAAMVSAAAATATAAAAGATSAEASEPLKVAFAYIGTLGDAGWTFAHDRGRKEMAAALGGTVQTSYIENVPENAEAEQVLRNLVTQGNKLIFGTALGFKESMSRLAKEFPEVKWAYANGMQSGENLRAYDVRSYQGAYLAGIIAGNMTRTDLLGFVASIPVPEVVRNINAFTLGAQSVNPSARTRVVWINKWLDPARESEAAQSLINGGADVLLQNTGSAAPLQVAEKAGKYAFGWDSDMKAFGPKAHLGSAIVNWSPFYIKAVRQVLEGKWKVQSSWWGLKEGVVDLVNLSDVVPADVKALVEEKKKAIANGSFRIWKGPMITSENMEILPTGAIGDDTFISSIMFYVKGVEGKVPAGS